MRRDDVSFAVNGERVAAWWYAPAPDASERAPCIVMGHGFAGVKEARLDAFAERFGAAGFACLVFDYRHFGGSGGEPRQLVSVRRQQDDWRAAIAFARSQPGVDTGRIGLWGTSFGGGHALRIAVDDPGVRALVLHMPLVDALAAGASEGLIHTARLVVAGLRDAAGACVKRAPKYVPVVARPGSLAFMATPEAEPGYFAIVRNAPAWRNEVPARAVFQLALFRPGRRSNALRCPALFVIGRRDTITPPEVTRRAALRAPAGEILELPGGHFDAYLGAAFEEAVAAETAFLATHLAQRTSTPAAAASARV
jgi:dienelactone hydrolase